jgi:peptidoglycan/LPS O-acetylase OafA/YrhL
MWSLHYEVVYYLLFLVLWRWPRLFLPSLVGAFVVSIAGWVLPPAACPRFLAGYASGWIFWGLGWWLSRQPRHESAGSSPPLLAGIFLLVATERLGCGNLLLHGLGFPQADISMVNLSNLVFLPCCLMLVAGAARLDLKLLPAATWLALLIPLGAAVAIVGTGRFGRVQSWTIGMAFTGLAWVAARWKSGDWLKRFAPLGRISYAFYLVHLPLLWALAGLGLSAVRPVGFVLSASAWFALAWGLAAALELRLQPRLRQWWQRRAAHS